MSNQSQLNIEGDGAVAIHIDEIEHAADAYIKVRDAFVTNTRKLQERQDDLRKAMHNHEDKLVQRADKTLVYQYDDLTITCTPGKEKVKIKAVEEDGGD